MDDLTKYPGSGNSSKDVHLPSQNGRDLGFEDVRDPSEDVDKGSGGQPAREDKEADSQSSEHESRSCGRGNFRQAKVSVLARQAVFAKDIHNASQKSKGPPRSLHPSTVCVSLHLLHQSPASIVRIWCVVLSSGIQP